jgi:hypothetical protein
MKIIKIASMDLYIEGYQQPEEMNNILDASFNLKRKLLYEVLTEKELQLYSKEGAPYDVLDIDGDSQFDATQGILNFYSYQYPEHKLNAALNALKYFAKEINSEVTKITGPERQGQKNEVYRIYIKMTPQQNKDEPPRINMANANAYKLFQGILNFNVDEPMDAWQIIARIDRIFQAQLEEFETETTTEKGEQGATYVNMGTSMEYMKRRLEEIKQVAQWAVNNNYQKLSLR